MKIGFVLDDTLDTPDGVQQYVITVGGWMSAQGHDVRYLVGATVRTDIAGIHSISRNMKVRFNGNRMSMPLPASRKRIRQLLAAEQFDVLHVQVPYSPFMAGRVIAACPARTAVIGTFHIAPNSQLVTLANRGLGIWLRRSLRRFNRIVSVSSAAAGFARQTYGLTTKIVANAVDLQPYATAQPLARLKGVPVVTFLGRLVPRKGCAIFLQALVRLRADHPELPFRGLVIGKGPLEQELRKYASAKNMDDIVEFTGFVSEQDKARYLSSSDIAVFPSGGGECFGIVLVEAMAANRPAVIGADNAGYRSVLAPGPDVLFPTDDPAALAEKLAGLLASPERIAAITYWQRHYVGQFDVAVVGQQLLRMYQEELLELGQAS